MDSLQRFLSAPEVELSDPATSDELDSFQAQTGLSLPASAIRLYRESNGLNIETLGLRFEPLDGVLKYLTGFEHWGITKRWGFFPFTDANDSNPHCICCNQPLNGRIVHVFHDDEATLDFRDLESFLDAVLTLVQQPTTDSIISDLPVQYDNTSDRSAMDEATGVELLNIGRAMPKDDPVRDQSLAFGLRLLPDSHVREFAALLDGSPPLRQAALKRLQAIQTTEARSAVTAYRKDWSQFRTDAVANLRRAGIALEQVKDDCVLIQPNQVWLDLGAFYEDHREADIFARLVSRAQHFVTLKRK